MIGALYTRYIKNKLFNKIFITFSTITIILFALFAYMSSTNIYNYYRNKAIEANEQVLAETGNYIEQKISTANDIIQSLYSNPSLYSEIYFLMENGYNEHLEYKLNNLFSSRENRYNGFENYFRSYFTRDNSLLAICIYSGKQSKSFVYSPKSRIIHPKDPDIIQYLNESSPNSYNPRVIPAHPVNYLRKNRGQNMVFSVAYEVKERFTTKTAGYMIFDYTVAEIRNSLFKSKLKMGLQQDYPGKILVLTPKGGIVFDSSGRQYGHPYPYFAQLKKGTKGQGIYRNNIIHTTFPGSAGLLAAAIFPEKAVRKYAFGFEKTIFLIACASTIAILLFTGFAIGAFSKRTSVVIEGMKKIRQGNLSARIPVKNHGDELSEIALSFNAMCEDLNTHINRVYLSEISRKNAQIKALQAQINPHFLYNTLESIRMRALASGAKDAGEMIYLLAFLFRNSVKEDMVISIHEEIKYAKMYLELHNIRFGDQVMVEFSITEETLDLGIIKHTIQPVIENYIIHGMNPISKDNRLKVSVSKHDQVLWIEIEDNGNGIPPEKLEAILASLEKSDRENTNTNGANIGLVNVNERIKLLFSPEYGLMIQSREGEGTTVTITMPAILREDMEQYVQSIHR